MNFGLLIGLTRLRVFLIVAGLAWFAGLAPPLPIRIAIGVLVAAALVFDGAVDEKRIASKVPPRRDRYRSAA